MFLDTKERKAVRWYQKHFIIVSEQVRKEATASFMKKSSKGHAAETDEIVDKDRTTTDNIKKRQRKQHGYN